jgi:hypothetical protein
MRINPPLKPCQVFETLDAHFAETALRERAPVISNFEPSILTPRRVAGNPGEVRTDWRNESALPSASANWLRRLALRDQQLAASSSAHPFE